MATSYYGGSDQVTLPAPTGGVTSDDLVPFPAQGTTMGFVGLATQTAAAGVDCSFILKGLVRGPKATGETWAIGAKLYLNSSSELTTTSTSNGFAGTAMSVQASGDTVGIVDLNGGTD